MPVTREQYEQRIAHLESSAAAHPSRYRFRVLSFALFGYAYLVLLVLGLLAALFGALASVVYLKVLGIKLVLVLAPFVWLVLRSLVVHIPPPTGVTLSRAEAPALFDRIERLRRAARAPRLHRIVVNEEFNAGIAQIPRLGLFGWHRNYLVLGLPFLNSLDPQQLDAVLAHEIGHLSGGHARLSNWLYRLRAIWSQLLDELHRAGHRGGGLIRRFFEWYVPRFNAYSFPLARANEYAADAMSVRLTSPSTAAEALTAVNVVGAFMGERYWPEVFRQADEMPSPALTPLARFADALGTLGESYDIERSVRDAMARSTSVDNTHPALADRLRAIGATPSLRLPHPHESAMELLGTARDRVVAQLDRRWQHLVGHDWRKRHDQVLQARTRLAELNDAGRTRALGPGEGVERARLESAHGAGADAAFEQLRELHRQFPDDALVNFQLGAMLLDRGDAAGQASIERAIELDVGAAEPGYAALRDFHWRNGDIGQANEWNSRAADAREEDDASRNERSHLYPTDRLLPPSIDAHVRDAIAGELTRLGKVKRAWIVRKHLVVRPQPPLHVIGFSLRRRWWRRDEVHEARVRNALVHSDALHGPTLVVCVDNGIARKIGAAMHETEDSEIVLPR
jgi:Zn-dependent protease with chaperone function